MSSNTNNLYRDESTLDDFTSQDYISSVLMVQPFDAFGKRSLASYNVDTDHLKCAWEMVLDGERNGVDAVKLLSQNRRQLTISCRPTLRISLVRCT